LDILGQIRDMVQDQTEVTFGEITTQRQQLELHVDKSECTDRMLRSLVTEVADRQSEDSRAGEHREKS